MKEIRINGQIPQHHEMWGQESARLVEMLRKHGILVHVIVKDRDAVDVYEKWWERAAMWFVRATFNKGVITDFAQTFLSAGSVRIYLPYEPDWDSYRFHRILRHELVHVLQAATSSWGRKVKLTTWSALLFAFLYTLVLPAVKTMRAKFEREAYIESLRVDIQGGYLTDLPTLLSDIEGYFRGPAYGFMDPIKGGGFGVGGDVRQRILRGEIHAHQSALARVGFRPYVPAVGERAITKVHVGL